MVNPKFITILEEIDSQIQKKMKATTDDGLAIDTEDQRTHAGRKLRFLLGKTAGLFEASAIVQGELEEMKHQ